MMWFQRFHRGPTLFLNLQLNCGIVACARRVPEHDPGIDGYLDNPRWPTCGASSKTARLQRRLNALAYRWSARVSKRSKTGLQLHEAIPLRSSHLVNPLGEEIAGLQLSRHFDRRHGLVLGEVLRALPLEVLDAVLRVRLASKVAVRRRLLVLWLPQSETEPEGTRPAIEGHLHDVDDVH